MSGSLKNKMRHSVTDAAPTSVVRDKVVEEEPESELDAYSKEVLSALMKDSLPPTPNNFSLYFDRLLEDKSQNTRNHIVSILELEDNNEDENSIILEQSLKQGFSSIKNILGVTANIYKNMSLMTKILEKRKQELEESSDSHKTRDVAASLESDILKLGAILKKQSSSMKTMYDDTAKIIKNVENETIFDNQYGVYNKRYLMAKIEQEIELISKFKHKSSLIMIELSRELRKNVNNEKAVMLMTRTIARLLLKTSRRSDIVAHYGNGVFAMLLKHTDIENAKRASERLCDLVSNSNFFLADREIQLKISIGITDITENHSVEEIIVSSMNGIEKAYENPNLDFAVLLRNI
ncbi:MAG: GGDEF domain-containing protein [Sulfurimonas sp.]|uniref:GGDEF domain-containing protein n=1 Tax=Sulfurimonas sp. TaxID=2022749 RepID=UPI00262DA87D|nr:GGDEF domain-containing protein [Sulfurimonas sp.]MDD5401090.1 GGDEF domain-containing protein [Sulfurimonas sp.]